MYQPKELEVEIERTETLVVFVRRPSAGHANWWFGFYSTDPTETLKWNIAIQQICKGLGYMHFHQGAWSVDHRDRHPGCTSTDLLDCPGVRQAWEIWIGCSDWAREFPDAPLDDILQCGDEALESVLEDVFPAVKARVAAMQW